MLDKYKKKIQQTIQIKITMEIDKIPDKNVNLMALTPPNLTYNYYNAIKHNLQL